MQLKKTTARLSSVLGLTRSKPPYLMSLRSSKPYVIATVAFAVFTDLFLYGLIVAVLPFSLGPRTGIEQNDVQSWISILLAVFAGACVVASPPIGWLSERSSTRRTPYLLGGVVLTASTLMLCLGRSIPVLLVARILQGASAAAAWIVGPSLIVDTFGKSNEIGKAMGYVGLAAASATVLGPVLGGVLYGAGGYYAPFGLAFGVLGLDLFFRFFLIEQSVVRRFDVTSAPEMSDVETSPADRTPTEVKSPIDTPPPIDSHSPPPQTIHTPPILRPNKSIWALLKSTRLLTATLATLSISILFTAFDAVLALHVEETFHWSATGAGLIYLPLMLPSLFAPLLGRLVDRYGARWSITAGFLIAVPPYVCLRFVTHYTTAQVVLLCGLLVVAGLGVAACLTPTMTEMSFVVLAQGDGVADEPVEDTGDKERGMASVYGIFNASFAAGNAIGPLWAGYVRDRYGWATMSWSLSLLAGVTGIITLIWLGGPIYKRKAKKHDTEKQHEIV